MVQRESSKTNQMELIQNEIQKLEKRLETLKAILEIRQRHPTLNYFTSKQCLLLQRFLHEHHSYLLTERAFALFRMVPDGLSLNVATIKDELNNISKQRTVKEKKEKW